MPSMTRNLSRFLEKELIFINHHIRHVAVNEKHIIKVPEGMSFQHAAAIPEVWLTAFQLLYWVSSVTSSEKIKDKTFLVHAGAR